ncbi:hypothetical protein KAT08_03160 [Candidatus Babeliales bacterium]|nr:hypothetical protein [Candidatus Babeliales bacterium]
MFIKRLIFSVFIIFTIFFIFSHSNLDAMKRGRAVGPILSKLEKNIDKGMYKSEENKRKFIQEGKLAEYFEIIINWIEGRTKFRRKTKKQIDKVLSYFAMDLVPLLEKYGSKEDFNKVQMLAFKLKDFGKNAGISQNIIDKFVDATTQVVIKVVEISKGKEVSKFKPPVIRKEEKEEKEKEKEEKEERKIKLEELPKEKEIEEEEQKRKLEEKRKVEVEMKEMEEERKKIEAERLEEEKKKKVEEEKRIEEEKKKLEEERKEEAERQRIEEEERKKEEEEERQRIEEEERQRREEAEKKRIEEVEKKRIAEEEHKKEAEQKRLEEEERQRKAEEEYKKEEERKKIEREKKKSSDRLKKIKRDFQDLKAGLPIVKNKGDWENFLTIMKINEKWLKELWTREFYRDEEIKKEFDVFLMAISSNVSTYFFIINPEYKKKYESFMNELLTEGSKKYDVNKGIIVDVEDLPKVVEAKELASKYLGFLTKDVEITDDFKEGRFGIKCVLEQLKEKKKLKELWKSIVGNDDEIRKRWNGAIEKLITIKEEKFYDNNDIKKAYYTLLYHIWKNLYTLDEKIGDKKSGRELFEIFLGLQEMTWQDFISEMGKLSDDEIIKKYFNEIKEKEKTKKKEDLAMWGMADLSSITEIPVYILYKLLEEEEEVIKTKKASEKEYEGILKQNIDKVNEYKELYEKIWKQINGWVSRGDTTVELWKWLEENKQGNKKFLEIIKDFYGKRLNPDKLKNYLKLTLMARLIIFVSKAEIKSDAFLNTIYFAMKARFSWLSSQITDKSMMLKKEEKEAAKTRLIIQVGSHIKELDDFIDLIEYCVKEDVLKKGYPSIDKTLAVSLCENGIHKRDCSSLQNAVAGIKNYETKIKNIWIEKSKIINYKIKTFRVFKVKEEKLPEKKKRRRR